MGSSDFALGCFSSPPAGSFSRYRERLLLPSAATSRLNLAPSIVTEGTFIEPPIISNSRYCTSILSTSKRGSSPFGEKANPCNSNCLVRLSPTRPASISADKASPTRGRRKPFRNVELVKAITPTTSMTRPTARTKRRRFPRRFPDAEAFGFDCVSFDMVLA